ncbi:MAG: CobW family GTP-binding protein [Christensenellales bacterium]|jgi:G3E family GTPase
MTKVTIISGFLGAGKTTLIKKLIAGGAFAGEKIVLLENEYGEIGVDGAFMKGTGVEVSELNAGCICCTIAGDFRKALVELIEKYAPDRVIIEPSGVGKLSEVRAAVAQLAETHALAIEACATVADVNRCRVYARNFGEFFADQIEAAESVVLSRTQMSSPEKIERALELLRAINPEARIITTPWDDLDAKALYEAIRAQQPLIEEAHSCAHCDCGHAGCDHDHDHDHAHHHDANEVFEDIGIETAREFNKAELEMALKALHDVDRFGSVLRAKGVVKLDDGSWAHFDYVPGACEVRSGAADYTGRLCVIGVSLDAPSIRRLFGL